MAKPEWGTKRSCPKCGARFYDLGKDSPLVCIDCAHEWKPEPILKSKQPAAEVVRKAAEKPKDEEAAVVEAEEDLEVEDEAAEEAADVADADDADDTDSDVSDVVKPPVDDNDH